MGKLKNEMFENLSQQELDEIFFNQVKMDESDYQAWLESDDYVNMVNEQLDACKPSYSDMDVYHALQYALDSMSVYPEEVGKDVYGKLIHEKVFEYLNNQNGL
jgi:hypothetical protein